MDRRWCVSSGSRIEVEAQLHLDGRVWTGEGASIRAGRGLDLDFEGGLAPDVPVDANVRVDFVPEAVLIARSILAVDLSVGDPEFEVL
jgi:hypothetical protein